MAKARAGIYVRISSDPTGLKAGVKRQEQDCREYCKRHGWEVAEVFTDNDTSAYRGKPRPAYKRLLEAIKDRELTALVVWHLDRLHRHPKELEEFLDVADAAGLKNLGTVSGDVDLSTHDGRLVARIMGAVAKKESDDKSRRLKRKMLELAQAGKNGGGGDRPFGFEADRVSIRSTEADIIREAARRILAGETVRSLVKDFKQRGVKTVGAVAFQSANLRRTLLRPRVAGLREHLGEPIAQAEWPAILDRETWEAVRAIFQGNLLRRANSRPARSYLLTGGRSFCGLCGAALVARPRADGERCYVCSSDSGGCGKIRSLAEPLEELIQEAALAALDSKDFYKAIARRGKADKGSSIGPELVALERRLERLRHDFYVEGALRKPDFLSLQTELEKRIEHLRSKIVIRQADNTLKALPGKERVRDWWTSANLDQRRALIAAVIERVTLNPAVKGRNRFDPQRVELVWRH